VRRQVMKSMLNISIRRSQHLGDRLPLLSNRLPPANIFIRQLRHLGNHLSS